MSEKFNKATLEAAITQIKPVEQTAKIRTVTKYDSTGKINNQLSDDQAVAIEVPLQRDYIFKIKVTRDNQLFDPYHGNKITNRNNFTKDLSFKFKEVSEKTFELYLKFLSTGYDSYYRAAQREVQ